MVLIDLTSETGIIDLESIRNEMIHNAINILRDHIINRIIDMLHVEKHEISPIVMEKSIGISFETLRRLLHRSFKRSVINESIIIVVNRDICDRILQYDPKSNIMLEVNYDYDMVKKISEVLNISIHDVMVGYVAEQFVDNGDMFIILVEKVGACSYNIEQHAPYTLSLSYMVRKVLLQDESNTIMFIRKIICG